MSLAFARSRTQSRLERFTPRAAHLLASLRSARYAAVTSTVSLAPLIDGQAPASDPPPAAWAIQPPAPDRSRASAVALP